MFLRNRYEVGWASPFAGISVPDFILASGLFEFGGICSFESFVANDLVGCSLV